MSLKRLRTAALSALILQLEFIKLQHQLEALARVYVGCIPYFSEHETVLIAICLHKVAYLNIKSLSSMVYTGPDIGTLNGVVKDLACKIH